jgi:hypothetical protein
LGLLLLQVKTAVRRDDRRLLWTHMQSAGIWSVDELVAVLETAPRDELEAADGPPAVWLAEVRRVASESPWPREDAVRVVEGHS